MNLEVEMVRPVLASKILRGCFDYAQDRLFGPERSRMGVVRKVRELLRSATVCEVKRYFGI